MSNCCNDKRHFPFGTVGGLHMQGLPCCFFLLIYFFFHPAPKTVLSHFFWLLISHSETQCKGWRLTESLMHDKWSQNGKFITSNAQHSRAANKDGLIWEGCVRRTMCTSCRTSCGESIVADVSLKWCFFCEKIQTQSKFSDQSWTCCCSCSLNRSRPALW